MASDNINNIRISLAINCCHTCFMDRFRGNWSSVSVLDNVFLPLGVEAIGGQAYYDTNIKPLIGTKLIYSSVFEFQEWGILFCILPV